MLNKIKLENLISKENTENTISSENIILNEKDNNSNNKENINNIENKKKQISNNTFNPDDYLIMMKIGQGNFSEVFLVENINTKVLYAMKQFLRQRVEQLKKQEEVLMEKHVMNKITPHKNIIGFGGSFRDSVNLLKFFIFN